MRNFKLLVEYDGSRYCGWQIQARHASRTIQETIEKALQKILQEKIRLIVSGRTDSGVHAFGQVANFKSHSKVKPDKLRQALNALLPGDITILGVSEAGSDFHSRFCAKSKVYRYIILNRPFRSSLLSHNVYLCRHPLDIKLMRQEARVILGKHDFKSFCASASAVKDTVRTIKKIRVFRLNATGYKSSRYPLIAIDIEADGFLYNMVRNIIGTLIEIGRGKLLKGSIKHILKSRDRRLAGPTAPACGLSLMKVQY